MVKYGCFFCLNQKKIDRCTTGHLNLHLCLASTAMISKSVTSVDAFVSLNQCFINNVSFCSFYVGFSKMSFS